MTTNQYTEREDLFYSYCCGTATVEEQLQVERLIADDVSMFDELEKVREAVTLQQRIHRMEALDVPDAFVRVHKTIRNRDRRRKWTVGLYRAAAILVLPLLLSSLIFGYMAFREEPEEIVYAEFVAAPGVVASFELPDQSKVWLNSNSKLRYPVRFEGKTRDVELDGEGYFEVKSDKEHPFFVATLSGIKVMAHGTRFNVSTYDRITETTLAEGKVAVLNNAGVLYELSPGEEASFHHETGRLEIQEVGLQEKLAWKDGKIIFRNAPLDKVFTQLSRRYNVDIVLHDEQRLLEQYSSRRVTFTNETIQQIFSYLEIAAPLEWQVAPLKQNSDSTFAKQRIDVRFKNDK